MHGCYDLSAIYTRVLIAVHKCVQDTASYAGRRSADGRIAFNFVGGNGMEGPYPDGNPNGLNMPFYDFATPQMVQTTPPAVKPGLWKVTVVMDDHPHDARP